MSRMNKVFYLGVAGLAMFEILDVYFIMPMPGSQGIESLGAAYFLHAYRWIFRVGLILMIAGGGPWVFLAGEGGCRDLHSWERSPSSGSSILR